MFDANDIMFNGIAINELLILAVNYYSNRFVTYNLLRVLALKIY